MDRDKEICAAAVTIATAVVEISKLLMVIHLKRDDDEDIAYLLITL